jgi:lipopolysaccharide export system permease protein
MQSAQERIMTNFQTKAAYLLADTFSYNLKRDTISDSAALALVRQDCDVFLRHIERNYQQIDAQKQQRDKFQIEIYKKYSIPAASLAFILIGAPLGMMTRRSGMGVAIAVSIILFLVYWAFLIGGEDLADRGMVEPFWAMWSANILMGAIGLYLIYVVVTEKPLFSWFRSQA